jgi:hypothetical protein
MKSDVEVDGGLQNLALLRAAGRGCCERRPSDLATMGGQTCYMGQQALLQEAACDATIARRWHCYPVAARVATMARWFRYHGTTVLLQMAADIATKVDRPCYKDRPTVLPWRGCFCCKGWPALLPWRGGGATRGGRRCYRRGAVVLQGADDIAVSVDGEATSTARCFSDDRQSAMAGAGMCGAGRRCCISYLAPPLTGSPAGFSGNASNNFSGNGHGSREERGGGSEELGGSCRHVLGSQIVGVLFCFFFPVLCCR